MGGEKSTRTNPFIRCTNGDNRLSVDGGGINMAEVKWIKITTDIFSNRKIRQIEAMPDADAIIVIWFKLLCLAGQINEHGLIQLTPEVPYTDEMLANEFGKPLNTVKLALSVFEKFQMIEIIDNIYKISNWEKYQNIDKLETIREKNRLRQARYREKTKQLTDGDAHNVTVTLPVTQHNAIDIDKDIDLDIDKDLDIDNIDNTRVVALVPYEEIIQQFNEICKSLPKVKIITEKRKKSIRMRWKKFSDINTYITVFQKVEASDFLSGRSGKWNGCNFDWVLKEANMVKILEGNYDNKKVVTDSGTRRPNSTESLRPTGTDKFNSRPLI